MQSMEPINVQAARWVVRVQAGQPSLDEQRELDAWLDADSRHRGAYVRARAQWIDLDRLAALHGPVSPVATQDDGRARLSRRELIAAGVAAIAVIGGGGSWVLLKDGGTHYASGIGEIRRIALEDGSTLLLNTASEVAVRFSEHRRSLQLIRGEALFEVTHDAQRPFLVHVNDIVVRAVGTQFAVRLEAAQVDVTVTEGIVELAGTAVMPGPAQSGPASSGLKPMRLAANQRAVIQPATAPRVEPIAPAESDRRFAWRTGSVSFDGESLQSAVAEINRHNRRQVLVDDPVLGAKPVVGVFRATDPEGFSVAAALALKASVVSDGDVIHLRPTSSTPH
jgi:transmembrane sensor